MGKLEGKTAVITGAGSGIGRAGALLFAREGATVVVVDNVEESVESTVDAIRQQGGRAVPGAADVARFDEVSTVVQRTIDDTGRIDILWNNAGIVRGVYTPIEEMDLETWHTVIDVNLHGVFHALKCVIPHMKAQQKGAIVNTASIAGLMAHIPGRSPYTASKGAVISLTRLLALELSGFNIRVNCIAPGRVRTNIGKDRPPEPTESPFGIEWARQTPTPVTDATRPAEPEEIAQTGLYLACDDVGPLTGVIIAHDGGATSR